MKNFKIRKVSDEELHSLKEELSKNWNKTCLIQSSIHLRLCRGDLENTKLSLYRAENPKFRSFIFMAPLFSEYVFRNMTVNWDPEEINREEVGLLLSNVPTWNWNKPFLLISCTYDIGIRFNEIFMKKLIIGNTTPMVECFKYSHRGLLMTLSKENLKKPSLRNEKRYKFGSLPSSAASLMHSNWTYNQLESVEGVQERIGTYEGVGVFYKEDDESETDTLVCWAQQYMHGSVGMTYTLPDHRNNGLGAAVTYELSKKILKDGRIPYVYIDPENGTSKSCHERIGYKAVSDVGFFSYEPGSIE